MFTILGIILIIFWINGNNSRNSYWGRIHRENMEGFAETHRRMAKNGNYYYDEVTGYSDINRNFDGSKKMY